MFSYAINDPKKHHTGEKEKVRVNDAGIEWDRESTEKGYNNDTLIISWEE